MQHYHVAIWIDHAEAKVYGLSWQKAEEWTVRPHDRHVHLHHKAGSIGSGNATSDKHYLASVTEAVKDAGEILITGPSSAKLELLRYLHEHAPDVEKKVVGIESLDHPTDGELVNFARKFFHAADLKLQREIPPRSI
jgi:stalled ribosome rescue protein Dom34